MVRGMVNMPTPKDRARIAVAADVSARTVQRIYEGEDALISTFRAVQAAAVALGLEPPQEPGGAAEAGA